MKNRFEVKGEIVLDARTGLEWKREYVGPMTWDEAMAYAKSLGDGWRLPTSSELMTLIDHDKINPASDFPGMPSAWFWTASSYAVYTSIAWFVDFYNGYVSFFGKDDAGRVRCVRGGPWTI